MVILGHMDDSPQDTDEDDSQSEEDPQDDLNTDGSDQEIQTTDGSNQSLTVEVEESDLSFKSSSQAAHEQLSMRESDSDMFEQSSPGREPPPQAKKQREQQREQQQVAKQQLKQQKHNEKNKFSEQAIRKLKAKEKKQKEAPPPNNGPRSPSIKSQIIVPRLTPEPKKNEDHNDIFKYKQKFDGKKGKIPNKVNHKQNQGKGLTPEEIEAHKKAKMENKNKDPMPKLAHRPANAVAKPVMHVQKKEKK